MTDETELQGALAYVRRRWLGVAAARSGARALAAAALVLLAGTLAERLIAPAGGALVLLAAVTLGAAGLAAAGLVWPLRRLPSDRQVARFVEERCPELQDRVATAVEAASGSGSIFRNALITDAAARLRSLDRVRLVSAAQLRRAGWQTAAGGALFALSLAMALPAGGRAWDTFAFYLFPVTLGVEVEPGDARIVTGRSLTIRATVYGARKLPAGVAPVVEYVVRGERRSARMVDDGSTWRHEFGAVTEAFRYRVAAGSAASPEFEVVAVTLPRVERIDVRYVYPDYTGLAPRLEEDGGDIYGPVGTEVTLRVRADRAIENGEMRFADGASLLLERDGDRELVGTLRIDDDTSYRVSVTDLDGLGGGGETEYFIRRMDDRPPHVRIVRPATDRQVTPLEEVTIEARANDDYGVSAFELVYSVRGREDVVVPFRSEGTATTRNGSYTLFLENLDVEPGDFVTYYARARDVSRGKASTEARSDIFFLEVRPFHEEFFAAQSQGMAGAGGADTSIDQLVVAQKEIIVATWKVDRRAGAGQSDEDVQTIAAAQTELRERVDQAAAAMQPRQPQSRRSRTPGGDLPSPGPGPAEGALAQAATAMGHAEAALLRKDPAGALPHEMEALNHLLKAQAEVRQRQVAQQQSGWGSPGRRDGQHQDLSTLFDRELQRQQQTNYASRSAADDRQAGETPEDEALERVRELARRQDELNRQQQELAGRQGQMTPEDIRRQLERLTREQTELRRRADELSRELSRRESARSDRQEAPAPDAAAGGQGSGGDQMQGVSEEMQNAASELQRQDAQGAAERGGRALDGLRALERQLRGAEPAERRRALGDLQLEARQVAEAQRRRADEAQRLPEGTAGTDARRRLAGDQERLADRVERLEHGVRELAAGGAGEERARLDAALRDLEDGRISERMRDAAEALRAIGPRSGGEGGGPSGETSRLADQEQQLARALEQVAGRLGEVGAPGDREAQRLSDQLAETRRLRERLADIERRIETMAGQAGPGDDHPGSEGRDGRQGEGRSGGAGGEGELARLQAEYNEELRKARDLLEQLQGDSPGGGLLATPEHQQYVLAAPGTEGFKQDFSRWDVLRRDVQTALEAVEVELSGRFADRETRDRLNAGANERMPEAYRRLVERYYQALASKKP